MSWDAVGAFAELLAAVATVATLAYLAIQIRQGSATSRAQIRQLVLDAQIQYLNSRASDPFLRRATQKIYAGEELDPEEKHGMLFHLLTHLRLFENHFAQHRLGTLDPEDWRAQRETLVRVLRFEAYRDAFEYGGDVWNRQFAEEVERLLAEQRASRG